MHQGNGHERDHVDLKMSPNYKDIFIVDIYNYQIYPRDKYAKQGIDLDVPMACYTKDEEYLPVLTDTLDKCKKIVKPDIIFYNAGTDILDKDPLGHFSISAEGVVKRDELVITSAMNLMLYIGIWIRHNQ